MLISKFDLYKSEWLELVFDDRNKAYGAYDLRQHYAGNMVKAMSITFLSIGLLCGAGIILKSNPVVVAHRADPGIIHVINLTEVKPPVAPPKPLEPVKPPAAVKTQQFIPMVVKPDIQVIVPAKMPDANSAVGPVTIDAKPGGTNTPVDITQGSGTTAAPPAVDKTVHTTFGSRQWPRRRAQAAGLFLDLLLKKTAPYQI
jgi:periplasmic protein TonB